MHRVLLYMYRYLRGINNSGSPQQQDEILRHKETVNLIWREKGIRIGLPENQQGGHLQINIKSGRAQPIGAGNKGKTGIGFRQHRRPPNNYRKNNS